MRWAIRTALAGGLICGMALPATTQVDRPSARPIIEARIPLETADRCLLTATGHTADPDRMTRDCAVLFEPCLSRAGLAGRAMDDPEVQRALGWLESCLGRDRDRRLVLMLDAIEHMKVAVPGGRPAARIMADAVIAVTEACAAEPDRLTEVQCQLDRLLDEAGRSLDIFRRRSE